MKQLGIAVHNFHDTHKALPPINISCGRASLFALLFPFTEQTALYDLAFTTDDRWGCGLQYRDGGVGFNRMFITMDATSGEWKCGSLADGTTSAWWKGVLAREEDKNAFGSVPYMKCPTRRSSGTQISEGLNNLSGPVTDYTIVTAAGPGTGWATSGYNKICIGLAPWDAIRFDGNIGQSGSFCHGPFRAALITPDWTSSDYVAGTAPKFGISSWTGRSDMALWADGSSNQFIFGERKIPIGKTNSCSTASGHWDCSYMAGTVDLGVTFIRSFDTGNGSNPYGVAGYIPIARANDSTTTGIEPTSCFGSWHTGICNFTLGDGSVRAVSVTTPPESILYPLARVDEGTAVSLP
jgi:hypothetical protein